MTALTSQHLAVCSWSLRPSSADDLIDKLRATAVMRTQLHLNPLVDGSSGWDETGRRLEEAEVAVVSGMMTTRGEDYTSLATIRRTGGIVPDEHWSANRATAERVADVAGALGVATVSLHAGFIPHDPSSAGFAMVRDRVAELADAFAQRGLGLLLETGQETAGDLLTFLDAVDRDHVGVNFDPANMLLYGMGDPIEAMRALMPRVRQVHVKDALPSGKAGEWGTEVAVGQGAVPWDRFVGVLREAGYGGDLVIEREAGERRVEDVKTAAAVIGDLL